MRQHNLPSELSPQLAKLVASLPKGDGWLYEIKFDGYRILARIEHRRARLFTRNGNDWTDKMASLAREIERLPLRSGWLDGEVVILGDNGVPSFNALQNAFDEAGTEGIVYFLFDAPFLNDRDLRTSPFSQRRLELEALLGSFDSDRVRLSQTFGSDGQSVLKSACKMGLEGVIAKKVNSPYRSARTDTWLKIKCQRRQEFVVGGFTPRANAPSEVGSLLLGVYETGKLRFAGSVGTGWKSDQGAALMKALASIEIDESPFDTALKKGRWTRRAIGSERWVKPTVVVEIAFGEWTPDGHVRHASFRGVRTDKPAKQVKREN